MSIFVKGGRINAAMAVTLFLSGVVDPLEESNLLGN